MRSVGYPSSSFTLRKNIACSSVILDTVRPSFRASGRIGGALPVNDKLKFLDIYKLLHFAVKNIDI